MSNETTPAIERAAAALSEYVGTHTQDMEAEGVPEMAVREAEVREALSAALDVEEMAREMVKHQRVAPYSERQCMCGVTVSSKETGAQHVAAAIHAALLGGAS
jgi:hypothetical protein